jgi:hypothetical protein
VGAGSSEEVDAVGGQRRKKGCRVTPKGGGNMRLTPAERAGLEEIFAEILRSAPQDLTDEAPLTVELWASQMWSIWANSEMGGMDTVEVFAGGFIKHAAKSATTEALMTLRALAAIAPEPYGSRARREAEGLASTGVGEPGWAVLVGAEQPTTAWLSSDPIDDDGVSVMVGFDGPGGPSTIGVYVDHNFGGMARDVFALPDEVSVVLAEVREDEDEPGRVDYREISLEEAAARWAEALELTDMTLDPPTSEDFEGLRALVMARLSKLPRSRGIPAPSTMTDEEREQLLVQFLESDETAGLWSSSGDDNEDDTVEHLAHQILTFSLDYVLGTPLRFSPVLVEMFCLDWAPRKVAVDGDGFTLLPDVLAAWIRFAGRSRGIPEEAIAEAVDATYQYAPEMIELSQDPETWGPAKILSLGIQQRGIDPTDQAALDDFVDEVNRNGGIDVLADSLAESLAPRR